VGRQHGVDMGAAETVRGFAKVGGEECSCVGVPDLNPVDDALGLALQLATKLRDVAVDHFLVNFETPVGRVEVEEAPADLSGGKARIDFEWFLV
jgi:hypothetical protein